MFKRLKDKVSRTSAPKEKAEPSQAKQAAAPESLTEAKDDPLLQHTTPANIATRPKEAPKEQKTEASPAKHPLSHVIQELTDTHGDHDPKAKLLEDNPEVLESEDELQLACRELNEAIATYLSDHPDPDTIEYLQRLHGALTSLPLGGNSSAAETLSHILSQQPATKIASKRKWMSAVGDFMSKLYPLSSIALGVAAAASEGATFMPLKGAANGVSILMQFAMEERGRGEDFMKQLNSIAFQSNRIAELQRFPHIVLGDILAQKSRHLMIAIINFLRMTLLYFKNDYFRNLGRTLALGPKIYTDVKEDLATAIAEYDQALLQQIAITVISSNINPPGYNDAMPAISEDFQAWLEPSLFETEAQLAKAIQLRAPKTLQWVLDFDEFRDWRLSSEKSKSVLWFCGLPGVGKTILSAYMIETLQIQYPGALVLYFFIKAGSPRISTVSDAIRTLAGQLAEREPDAKLQMDIHKSKGLKPTSEVGTAQIVQNLLRDPLRAVQKPVFIVIDGLDEFDSAGDLKDELDTFFRALISLECRILFCSRNISSVSSVLDSYPTKQLTSEYSCYDIELYVKQKLEENPVIRDGFAALKVEPVPFLTERSNGNFLWVSVVLDLLIRSRTLSTKEFNSVIETLPSKVSTLYENLLAKVEQGGNLPCAIAILEYILHLKRRINLSDLKKAIELDIGENIIDIRRLITHEFGEFLIIVRHGVDEETVQIGHETFRTYVVDDAPLKYRAQVFSAHARIARICLKILNNPTDASPSLQEYAIRFWLKHMADYTRDQAQIDMNWKAGLGYSTWIGRFKDCKSKDELEHGLGDAIIEFLSGDGLPFWIARYPQLANHQYLAVEFWRNVQEIENYLNALAACLDLGSLTGSTNHSESLQAHLSITTAKVWLNTMWDTYEISKWMWLSSSRIWLFWKLDPPYGDQIWARTLDQLKEFLEYAGYDQKRRYHTLNAAVAYVDERVDIETAEEYLWQAHDEEPDHFLPLEAFGHMYAYGEHKDIDKCLKYFDMAMKADYHPLPGCSIRYWDLFSKHRNENGDFQGACQVYLDALEYPAGDHRRHLYDQLASLYESKKDYAGAREVYCSALKNRPEEGWRYWQKIAEYDEKLGDWKAQIDTYLNAIRDDPESESRYLEDIERTVNNQKDKQNYEQACEILNYVMDRTDIQPTRFQKLLVEMCLQWGQWKKALDVLEYLIPLSDEEDRNEMWQETGDACMALGEFEKAIDAYKNDAREGTRCAETAAWLGRAYFLSGQHQPAIREFKKAIRESKADEPAGPTWSYASYSKVRIAILWLAKTYEAVGREKEAKKQYEVAKEAFLDRKASEDSLFESNGSDTFWRSQGRTFVTLAHLNHQLGDLDAARGNLERAIEIFEVTTYEDDDEYEKSEHEHAVKELERLSQDPVPPSNPLEFGDVLHIVGRDLIFNRRANWGVRIKSKPPRHRP